MIFIATPLLANETHNKSHLVVNVKDGLVSIDAEDVLLSKTLEEIGEKATPPFNVKSFTTVRITVSFKNQPLKEAISQLAKKNYAFVFNKQTNQLKSIFLMPDGSGTSTVILDTENDVAKIFPGPQSNASQRINEYIKERHECLNNIAHQEPQKNIIAQVSLSGFLPAIEVMSKIRARQLIISELNHGWRNLGGGYKVYSHLSQEETLKDFIQKHETFLLELLQDSSVILKESERHTERDQGIKDLIQNAEEQLVMAKEGVVMVYGATVTGNARSISDLTRDSIVKLVDTSECSEKTKDILKNEGYEARVIFIPLKPE